MEEPMHDDDQTTGTARTTRRRWSRTAAGLTATGVLVLTGAVDCEVASGAGGVASLRTSSRGPITELFWEVFL
jgi:hypothetical protein